VPPASAIGAIGTIFTRRAVLAIAPVTVTAHERVSSANPVILCPNYQPIADPAILPTGHPADGKIVGIFPERYRSADPLGRT
jgi:hypothetical protein